MSSIGSDRARATLAYLRRKITTGEWEVGHRIPIEPELAEQAGVGRSTIREAVRSLASMGMLETLPGRGTYVRSVTPTSTLLNEFLNAFTLEEILSYRRALQIEAAQQASQHRTDEDIVAMEQAILDEDGCNVCPIVSATNPNSAFESQFLLLLFDAAKNRLLASLYAGINEQLRAQNHRGRLVRLATAKEVQKHYAQILDAVKSGDFINTVHAMAKYVDHDIALITDEQEIVTALNKSPEQLERINSLDKGES